jgi:hypothetical protein
VGAGAKKFALECGFQEQELLTNAARETWLKWRASRNLPLESHDTIGFIALDARGHLAAVLSTSGLAWKLAGRVGDSPIAGAGLFVDAGAGAACGTGVGEEIMRVAGSAVIVEAMRHGASPQEGVEEAVRARPPTLRFRSGSWRSTPRGRPERALSRRHGLSNTRSGAGEWRNPNFERPASSAASAPPACHNGSEREKQTRARKIGPVSMREETS